MIVHFVYNRSMVLFFDLKLNYLLWKREQRLNKIARLEQQLTQRV